MIKIKRKGFTLSEVLIALTIIGTLAILVLPGLIKDTNNRAMMSNLQSAVSTLNNAVQNELIKVGTNNVQDTNIVKDPLQFLIDNLDVKTVCSNNAPNSCYADTSKYINLNGSSVSLWSTKKAVLLSSGVTIDILSDKTNQFTKKLPVGIDLNGAQQPNIAGVDRHIVCITLETDPDEGLHAGEVGACLRNGYSTSNTRAQLVNACKAGTTEACYYLAETSGFDPNYIEITE